MSAHRGFTLVEVLVAIALGMVVMAAIYTVVSMGQLSSASIEKRVTTQQDVRAALEIMAREIQMASYNPTGALKVWRSLDCGNTPKMKEAPDQALKGIQIARADSMMVQMDIDESGEVGDASNEVIQYNHIIDADHPENNRITRTTNCGSGQPFLGWDEAPRIVRVINADPSVNIPVFRYFDAKGDTATSVADVRRILITLAVESDEIDPNTRTRKKMIYSTSVVPRNHATKE